MIKFQPLSDIPLESPHTGFEEYKKEVLNDYWICALSREFSLVGRREVLNGRGKFGIFGDGKEVPQIAMARAFKNGDWRSGYYRDQTFMLALGITTVDDMFAQLFSDTKRDPFSSGRQMNNHYATSTHHPDGEWLDQTNHYNVSSDISCTAGQMSRSLGLAMASKKYRKLEIPNSNNFSNQGNEVSFVTIGDASTSEGVFWETINAAAVMQVPLVVIVWDDGYGISVPIEKQTVKGSISKALRGFAASDDEQGIKIHRVKGWNYPELCATFEAAANTARQKHQPVLVHVTELTQPQGHSTSGSHERYKSSQRLEWEREHDCFLKFEEWILTNGISDEETLTNLKEKAILAVRESKSRSWKLFNDDIIEYKTTLVNIVEKLDVSYQTEAIAKLIYEIKSYSNPYLNELLSYARQIKLHLSRFDGYKLDGLEDYIQNVFSEAENRYHTNLYSDTKYAALNVAKLSVKYDLEPKVVPGFQVLNTYFDELFNTNQNLFAFGEDVGQIGDVNQGFAGIQNKYGEDRVFDTGIREWTILGQAMGASMRGLKCIAEIQYLDYLAYAFSICTDDIATLRYRTNGKQRCPLIIRTRGHRLEGIWHSGSPMSMIISSMRGMYLCVPRNMTQAVGFYNTLLKSDDPGIVIESLNGYRLKEKLPNNLLEYTIPLGMPEILSEGNDVTLVTYGSCLREAQKALELLQGHKISVELIDVQTLMPFDLEGIIVESLKKTNRIIFLDEDIPGGATAFMMQEVLEKWNGYQYLDARPMTVTAKDHRTPYGSDGDYFTKPNPDQIFEAILQIMKE